jgi:hypothetical protein
MIKSSHPKLQISASLTLSIIVDYLTMMYKQALVYGILKKEYFDDGLFWFYTFRNA